MHRLDANTNRGNGSILIQIAEREMRFTGLFDNLLDHPADERIMTAFEVGELDRNQIGVPGDKLGRPDLVV